MPQINKVIKFAAFILFFNALSCLSRSSLPPIDITATQLISEYQENPETADERYKRHVLNITAKIGGMMQKNGDDIAVAFLGDNPNVKLAVTCIFDKSQHDEIWKYKYGQTVLVTGTNAGRISGSAIFMDDCRIK